MLRTLDLLASDSSHLPFLFVFKESKVMEKYGFEIDLHIVGGAKAPTMAHRSKLALAGEIDFLSGLHHETYRARAKGEKRLTYLAQAQNNWDDRLVANPKINSVDDLKGQRIICHSTAPCVAGNLRAILQTCGLKPEEIRVEVIEVTSGKHLNFVDEILSNKAAAALVDMPFDLYGTKKGLKLVNLPDRPVIHNTTLLATSDYIKENEETVYAFLKGFIEALHFFKTQPEKVVPILKKNLAQRYGLEEEEYYVHLQREWARLLSKKPYPLASAIQNVYELDVGKDPAMKDIGPMEPWDLHYLRAIDDSGFIDRLYAA
ncbi:MAG TPA: ABC transporter substrate-binding protein [Candidatus Acidoferrales bacterium]|nr:ABC transporter substrate-binding protein [Candidatus Acidoferrales bacterium]